MPTSGDPYGIPTTNPYAMPVERNGQAQAPVQPLLPHAAYAVPGVHESATPGYQHTAYAARLDPDPIRLGEVEPPPAEGIDVRYQRGRVHADELTRHLRAEQYVHGWDVRQKPVSAPTHPLWSQPRLPTRPTANNSPLGYQMTRPWHIPRPASQAIGPHAVEHLSMADHRRDYDINLMSPRGRASRRTFRLEPGPQDAAFTVPVGEPSIMPRGGPIAENRAYRLGG